MHVPPSVHGNNGVAMLHSPGVVQYSPKRSSSVTEVGSRGVSSSPSDASPCGSPVKKFAAANERSSKPTPTQLPWTHIKIQTQPKGNEERLLNRIVLTLVVRDCAIIIWRGGGLGNRQNTAQN